VGKAPEARDHVMVRARKAGNIVKQVAVLRGYLGGKPRVGGQRFLLQ
jgi:hypothetical protein